MKAINNNILGFKNRVLNGQLSINEAVGMFVVLVTIASIFVYAFAPQAFIQ
jgi:4-hydroxybenzoate polyprenyltransferase